VWLQSTITWTSHAEGDEGVECLEDDGRLHHAVVVELAQELGTTHTPLVVLRVVDLITPPEGFTVMMSS